MTNVDYEPSFTITTYVMQSVLVLAWLFALILSRYSKWVASRSISGSSWFRDGRLALLPLFEHVTALKIFANMLLLATQVHAHSFPGHGYNADGTINAEGTWISMIGILSLSVETMTFPLVATVFAMDSCGTRARFIGLSLSCSTLGVMFGSFAGLCGWNGAPLGVGCYDARWSDIQPELTFQAAVGFVVLCAAGLCAAGGVLFEWRIGFRQPLLLGGLFLLLVAWGLSLIFASFEPEWDLQIGTLIPQVNYLVSVVILYMLMRHDSQCWSSIELAPMNNSQSLHPEEYLVELATSSSFSQTSPKHIPFGQLHVGSLVLGRGSTAVVRRGKYENKAVAVKCMSLDSMSRDAIQHQCYELLLAHEFRNHPNVVKFLGFSVAPPWLYLAMELCAVGDLGVLLHESGRHCHDFPELYTSMRSVGHADSDQIAWEVQALKVGVRRHLLCGLADAVQYIHGLGFLHRDIKSYNVLVILDSEQSVGVSSRLTDWGSAIELDSEEFVAEKAQFSAAAASGLLSPAEVQGTIHWMAPEVIVAPHIRPRAVPEYSKASDLFALGMVFYECLERKRPTHVSIRQRLDPEFVYPSVTDRDGFGIRTALIQQCWSYCPHKRGEASALHALIQANSEEWSAHDHAREHQDGPVALGHPPERATSYLTRSMTLEVNPARGASREFQRNTTFAGTPSLAQTRTLDTELARRKAKMSGNWEVSVKQDQVLGL